MSENRQFVVRVLDVAQGAGALVQVDDQPPRWLSANDSLAVDVPKPDPSQDERRTPIAAGWGRHVHTLWICPRCSVGHTITGDTWLDCGCGARYRFVYGDEPEADEPERWIGWSEGEMRRIRAAMSSLAAEEGLGDLAEEFSSAVDREYARREEAKAPTYRGPGYYTGRVEENHLSSMGTLYESKGDQLPAFGSREYLLELRDEVDRLLESSVRSESEVRAAIERLAQETHGSYEELAGAEWALRWVLGESEWSEDAAREKKP